MGDIVSGVLVLAGAVLAVLAGVGVVRFPDVLTRMHAQSKVTTLAALLVLGGVVVAVPRADDVAKVVLVALLLLITTPVAAHLVGRSVYRRDGVPADTAVAGGQDGPRTNRKVS